jgi:hypothetical protein
MTQIPCIGGAGDTVHLANTTLNLFGTSEIVFIGMSNATDLKIGPTAGNDILSASHRIRAR